MIEEKYLKEYKIIYKQKTGKDIPDQEALRQFNKLVMLVKNVYQPIKKRIMRNSKRKTKVRVVYEQVENPDQDAINRAYDILFDEVLRIKKEKRQREGKKKC